MRMTRDVENPMSESLDPRSQDSRGRGPSPDKTARTRRAIVVAALDMFLERGFSETRMIDVAKRAGVAKGTLYIYFTDKEALFEGVLRDVIAAPISSVRATAPEPDESVRAFLARAALPLMRDMEGSRRAAVVRLIVAEGARFPALAEMYRRVALEPIIDLVRHLAQRAIARGEIVSDAFLRFPMLLFAPGLMATVWNGLYGSREPLDTGAVFEAYIDLIFKPSPDDDARSS